MDKILSKIEGLELLTQTPEGEPGITLDLVLPLVFPFTYTGNAATVVGALQKKYNWILEQLNKKIWVKLDNKPNITISETTGHIEDTNVVLVETYLKCYRNTSNYFLEMTVQSWINLGAGANFINGRFPQFDELNSIKVKLETGPLPEKLIEVELSD